MLQHADWSTKDELEEQADKRMDIMRRQLEDLVEVTLGHMAIARTVTRIFKRCVWVPSPWPWNRDRWKSPKLAKPEDCPTSSGRCFGAKENLHVGRAPMLSTRYSSSHRDDLCNAGADTLHIGNLCE